MRPVHYLMEGDQDPVVEWIAPMEQVTALYASAPLLSPLASQLLPLASLLSSTTSTLTSLFSQIFMEIACTKDDFKKGITTHQVHILYYP
jgi:hypothetical protein